MYGIVDLMGTAAWLFWGFVALTVVEIATITWSSVRSRRQHKQLVAILQLVRDAEKRISETGDKIISIERAIVAADSITQRQLHELQHNSRQPDGRFPKRQTTAPETV